MFFSVILRWGERHQMCSVNLLWWTLRVDGLLEIISRVEKLRIKRFNVAVHRSSSMSDWSKWNRQIAHQQTATHGQNFFIKIIQFLDGSFNGKLKRDHISAGPSFCIILCLALVYGYVYIIAYIKTIYQYILMVLSGCF